MMKASKFADSYFKKIKKICDEIDVQKIALIVKIIEDKFKKKKTIFIAGNGGSASTASHMVCDLGKTVLGKDFSDYRKRFKVISLSDNIPLLTAFSNDCSNEVVFSEPLKNFGRKGDLLIVISGSGNSRNIIKAVEIAHGIGIDTVAFLGFDGGKVREIANYSVVIPSREYGPIEDFHLILNHLITGYFAGKIKK